MTGDAAAQTRTPAPMRDVLALLANLVRYSPWHYAATLVPQALRLSLVLAPGLIARAVFDHLTQQRPLGPDLWLTISLFVVVALLRVWALLSAVYLEHTAFFRSVNVIRMNLFERFMRRPIAHQMPFPPGEVVSRMGLDGNRLPFYLTQLENIFGSGVGATIAFAAMASVNLPLASLALLPLLVSPAAVALINYKRLGNLRNLRNMEGRISALLGDAFGAVQALQIAGAEGRAVEQLERLNGLRKHYAVRDEFMRKLVLDSLVNDLAMVVTAAILVLAARALHAGTFSVGDFVLFSYAAARVTDFGYYVGMSLSQLQESRVAVERMIPLLDGAPPRWLGTPSDWVRGLRPGRPGQLRRLDVNALSHVYAGSGRGISAARFSIEAGEIIVVTGRIGSGKTTLLRTLLGLLPAQSGGVFWNGEPVAQPNEFFVPPRSAYTPQTPRLFSEALRSNILLGRDPAAIEPALWQAVMSDDVRQLERGLDTLVGPRGVKLSGGQLQRAAAARMFAGGADLLVFDDLSSALDVMTEETLWARLRERLAASNAPGAILAVSNRRGALRLATRILVLKDGEIIDSGPLDALLERCAEMREIWQATGEPIQRVEAGIIPPHDAVRISQLAGTDPGRDADGGVDRAGDPRADQPDPD